MKRPKKTNKKRINQVEFTKEMLLYPDRTTCTFCKYHRDNYTEITDEAIRFFHEKCHSCDHSVAVAYVGEENIPYWFNNNFKLLYFWDKE